MECTLCKKQYAGKSETGFKITLNNHRKDFKKPDAILAYKHFQKKNHVFNKHTKFIIIDKLTNTAKSKDWLKEKNFEHPKHPKGLNKSLVLNKKTAS